MNTDLTTATAGELIQNWKQEKRIKAMKDEEACGCVVVNGPISGLILPYEISLCPLHAAAPALRELVGDLHAWIEFALNDIKFRAGRVPPTFTDGYSYVEIPEWAMRQKLESTRAALVEEKQ